MKLNSTPTKIAAPIAKSAEGGNLPANKNTDAPVTVTPFTSTAGQAPPGFSGNNKEALDSLDRSIKHIMDSVKKYCGKEQRFDGKGLECLLEALKRVEGYQDQKSHYISRAFGRGADVGVTTPITPSITASVQVSKKEVLP